MSEDDSSKSEPWDSTKRGPPAWGEVLTNDPNDKNVENLSEGRKNLRNWLGKLLRIKIADGRIFVGYFSCTDRDANVILSSCFEFRDPKEGGYMLGEVMIPGKYILSVCIDTAQEEKLKASTDEATTSK